MSERDQEITVGEAARILGTSRQVVHYWLDKKRLRVVRWVGGFRLLDRSEVERFELPGHGWRKGRAEKNP